jgi:mannose-6-phosphate isomerase-like protein (cupin superfamily)
MSVVTDIERGTTVIARSARAGQMGPLHRRDERETYRVVEGELTFYVGGEVVQARAGDVVVAPGGAVRTFRAGREGARWLVFTRVRSLESYADFSRAVARTARELRWPSAEEWVALESLGAANGIELLGPPGALPH